MLQWVIYDTYAEDYAQQEKEKEKEKDKKSGGGSNVPAKKETEKSKKQDKALATEELNKAYLQAWQILERMINQNIYDDIAQGETAFILSEAFLMIKWQMHSQIIATTRTHRTNFVKKKARCCRYGNFRMKKRKK